MKCILQSLQRALQHIDKHGFITLQEYAKLNRLNYSTASRELAKLVLDPHSDIRAKGAGSYKVWVSNTQGKASFYAILQKIISKEDSRFKITK